MKTTQKTPPGRPIRFGIVGCGRIAGRHIEAIGYHADEARLVAACDIDSDSFANVSLPEGCVKHESIDHLLEDDNVDCIILCTPSGLHSSQAMLAARHGKHVITEKPMATRWADGKAMVEACDQAGVHLFVVKQNRHNSTLQALKRALEKRRFGQVYMVNINVFWARPQEYYDSARWRGTWEFDGGALMNQASHYIDLLDWLIGPVESVQALTATLGRRIEVEDTAVVNVRWRSGALGSINATVLTYPQNREGSITILGQYGTVKIAGVAVNTIEWWEFDEPDATDQLVTRANYETTSVYGYGHTAYYRNVLDTLRGTAEPQTDGREGLKSLEILIATYLSARDGRRVALPLEY